MFEQGFSLAWVGWQFDLPKSDIRLEVPAAPIHGLVRETILVEQGEEETRTRSLSAAISYCATDTAQPGATLTLKSHFDDPGKVVPRSSWSFARENGRQLVPEPCRIFLTGGFKTDQLYEVVYQGTNPAVAGLGLAAIRDFTSYLKYGGVHSALRDHPETEKRVLGYGYSQSARLLRQYLYDGFNCDEHGRQTFDGLFIASAGAGRGSFNHRYALPGEAGNSVLSDLRPVDIFPFTDESEDDPVSNMRDGLLYAERQSKSLPKLFYIYSSTEYWARIGSLAYTTVDGSRELPIDDCARLYFYPGTAHDPAPFPPVRTFKGETYFNLANFSFPGFSFRALLLDLDDWVANGTEPPASVYPHLPGELVVYKHVRFPNIPGFDFPMYMPRNWRMDFGGDFYTKGIIANEPPKLGPLYTVLVPQVNQDGNDVGGIALPFLAGVNPTLVSPAAK